MYRKTILALALSLMATGFLGLDEAPEININPYKDEMLEGLKNPEELFDMTRDFYNDPDMADFFIEAHFNSTDFPDMPKGVRVKVDENTYRERAEAYKIVRGKKYLLSSTTVLFTEFGKLDEYPTGGLLCKKDYNKEEQQFEKTWLDIDLWSKYRWRIKGNKHESSMVIMDGEIKIEMPRNEAKNLTGDHLLLRTKKATFMAVFRIKEKGKDYLVIEPIRYMIVWRRKGKVYTNFEAPFDEVKTPAGSEKGAPDETAKNSVTQKSQPEGGETRKDK